MPLNGFQSRHFQKVFVADRLPLKTLRWNPLLQLLEVNAQPHEIDLDRYFPKRSLAIRPLCRSFCNSVTRQVGA